MSCAKTAEPIETSFGTKIQVGQKEPCKRRDPDQPRTESVLKWCPSHSSLLYNNG